MKLADLLEAKKARNGAILKGGYMLEKDPANGDTDIWILKRMLEDEELAEATIFTTLMGEREYIFKISSYVTGEKASTRIRGGAGASDMDAETFRAELEARLFDWVEAKVNAPDQELVK